MSNSSKLSWQKSPKSGKWQAKNEDLILPKPSLLKSEIENGKELKGKYEELEKIENEIQELKDKLRLQEEANKKQEARLKSFKSRLLNSKIVTSFFVGKGRRRTRCCWGLVKCGCVHKNGDWHLDGPVGELHIYLSLFEMIYMDINN